MTADTQSASGGDHSPSPEAELEVLFPDREVTVRDPDTGAELTLTVREFRFLEGLRAQVVARPLLEALADVADGPALADTDAVAEVLAAHAEVYIELIGLALESKSSPAWLARLGAADGDALSIAMWEVNAGFFMHRVARLLAARKRKAGGSPSGASSTPSSAPDTAAGTTTSPDA